MGEQDIERDREWYAEQARAAMLRRFEEYNTREERQQAAAGRIYNVQANSLGSLGGLFGATTIGGGLGYSTTGEYAYIPSQAQYQDYAWANAKPVYAIPIEEKEDEVDVKEDTMLINNFKIGCDPEFVAFDKDGQHMNVAAILTGRSIGFDHNGAVGELRPTASLDTWVILNRLKALVNHANLRQFGKLRGGAKVEWKPSPWDNRHSITLGGHIHIDINPYKHQANPEYQDEEDDLYVEGQYSVAHSRRLKALDYLTKHLEALDILPAKECEERRKAGEYGKWGQFRVKGGAGTKYRTEYRTMPSWLYSPKVAYLCLTGAKLCAAYPGEALDCLGKPGDFGRLKRLFERFGVRDSNAKRAQEWLLEGDVRRVQAPVDVDFRERWMEL
jgi:hypothetical protein